MGVDFYPAGRGIGHQIMCEEGYAWPGTMAVASDSHSNMYGGMGCLGTPVVRTDAAALWATGKTWWQIPPISKRTLIVVQLKEKIPVDQDKFVKAKQGIVDRLLLERKDVIFKAFLDRAKSKMEKSGEISIDQSSLINLTDQF